MANKAVYQEYNEDALKHFDLEESPTYGVLSSNEVSDVLITNNQTVFENIRNILEDNTKAVVDISNYKRGFILPRCTVSADRIKETCKEHGITITNDYEKADFIISHDQTSIRLSNGEKILTSVLLYKLWNFEAYSTTEGRVNFIDAYTERTNNSVIWDSRLDEYCKSYRLSDPESLYDEWAITGLALNLAYLVDTGELDVVNVDDLMHQSSNKTELTDELVTDIINWVQSYNDENIALVAKVLPTIKVDENYHLLWKLAQGLYPYSHSFNRDKDVQYWLSTSKISKYYRFTAEEMIKCLEDEDLLDSKSFRYLEPIVRQEIKIYNRELYVFKVQIKPEYSKYLKINKDE